MMQNQNQKHQNHNFQIDNSPRIQLLQIKIKNLSIKNI